MTSKRKATPTAPKRLTAADILAKARQRAVVDLPSEEALAELEQLMRANDAEINRLRRVRADDAIELLKSHGWPCGRNKFTRLIREQYGRGWER